MENLLNPDSGLIIWTVVMFAILVFVLGRFAWKPLIDALNKRELGIRHSLDEAASARQSAVQMKSDFERELAKSQDDMRKTIAQAQADAEAVRDSTLKQAQDEARKLMEQTRAQLEEDRQRMARDLREEVAGLSVKVAEKLLRHAMNSKEQEALVSQLLKDIEKEPRAN